MECLGTSEVEIPLIDAGPLDAGSIDAGAAPDAARFIDTGVTLPDAGPPRAAGGCSVARRGPSAWVWLGLALAGLAATRRRRGVS
jgi:MYXO-CTERM domain-containing protein